MGKALVALQAQVAALSAKPWPLPHLGKRGRVLLFFGALDLIYAVSLAAPDATSRRVPMFVWLAEVAPLWAWSAMWAGVGVACLWQAFCRRDAIGFAAAIALKVC